MKLNRDDIGSKITELHWSENEYRLIRFKPSISELFYQNWFPFRKTKKQIVRYLMEYLQSGYFIYYLVDNTDEIIGQCMAQKTGHGRYSVLGNNDYVIGPYVIREEYRGRGLSIKMIGAVLTQIPEKCNVYDWIQKENAASLAATKRVGGVPINGMTLSPIMRRFKLGEITYGDYLLIRIERKSNKLE